jgi:hypothetical protein
VNEEKIGSTRIRESSSGSVLAISAEATNFGLLTTIRASNH